MPPVVWQVVPEREPAGHPRVSAHQGRHLVSVPRQDHHHRGAVVLHFRQKRAHGLVAEHVGFPPTAAVPAQRVGFVQKQAPAEGRADGGDDFGGSVPDVFSFELKRVALHEHVSLQHPVRPQEAKHEPRHRRLARAWVAREHHVEARTREDLRVYLAQSFARLGVPHFPAHLLKPFLDSRHPNERFNFVVDVPPRGSLLFGGQVGGGLHCLDRRRLRSTHGRRRRQLRGRRRRLGAGRGKNARRPFVATGTATAATTTAAGAQAHFGGFFEELGRVESERLDSNGGGPAQVAAKACHESLHLDGDCFRQLRRSRSWSLIGLPPRCLAVAFLAA
mmetsp:Transcript_6674/g.11198  ORF Transcript_6674/g.11198 Transcript_6674/m.11198 type:complete len:333 (+) Transcript_6674:78-1076(+)